MATPRKFEEIRVENFVAQMNEERYPDPEEPEVFDDPNAPGPSIAPWRSNLIAASQRYNLYFAAFQDKIHVTIPRGLRQTIPPNPDAILEPPRSVRATPGYINPEVPHAINHMRVGNLGDLEILLFACDDGDVLAYYTHILMHDTKPLHPKASESPGSGVKPFFHENVGISAWGLAIHQKSRLIGVGSNLREVTLFKFAKSIFGRDLDVDNEECEPILELTEETAMQIETLFRLKSSAKNKRHPGSNFHKYVFEPGNPMHTPPADFHNVATTYKLKREGHNIPSVDFASDPSGDASHILAADIHGNLWYIEIATGKMRFDPRLRTDLNPDHQDTMSWGILNLPLSYFKTATNPEELLEIYGSKLLPGSPNANFETTSEKPQRMLSRQAMQRLNVPDGSALLRTFNQDVQLLPPTHSGGQQQAPRFTYYGFLEHQVGFQGIGMDRLNLLAIVPELHLVAVGSQSGQVALVTLTRLRDNPAGEPIVMFTRDKFLPLPEHLPAHRPQAPLLGMTIAPIQKANPEHERWENQRKIFRLFMHYYDHTILSYEISRADNDELRVF